VTNYKVYRLRGKESLNLERALRGKMFFGVERGIFVLKCGLGLQFGDEIIY